MNENAISSTQLQKIPVGISACLLGEEVRYNGGHKLSLFCRDHLARWFEFRDICPEVEIGLDVPREPIRLVETDRGMEVQPHDGGADYGPQLSALAQSRESQLAQLCGFIFMQKSPSCGLFRVPVHGEQGQTLRHNGRGQFAEAFTRRFPNLPVEEAGRLNDPELRENFILRVFITAEWRQLCDVGLSRKRIGDFHSRQKYLLMAHSPRHYALAGRLLARAGHYSPGLLGGRYFNLLMSGLGRIAGRGGHANALQHMQGYLKRHLSQSEKTELAELIHAYRRGEVPLVAPLVLLKHHSPLASDYYRSQSYLQPHPPELGLRNSI